MLAMRKRWPKNKPDLANKPPMKKVRSRILYLKGRRILEGIRGVRRHRGHRLSATPALNIGHR